MTKTRFTDLLWSHVQLRQFAGAASALLLIGGVRAQESLPTLTQGSAVRALSRTEAARAYPVHLRGVVTGCDPARNILFLQDSTSGLAIDFGDQHSDVQSGTQVEVDGFTAEGKLTPRVSQAKLRISGSTVLPAARLVTREEWRSGTLESQWVEVRGVVRSLTEDAGQVRLEIAATGDRIYKVRMTRDARLSVPATDWVDAVVRIQGVCNTVFNAHDQLIGMELLVCTPKSVQIEKSAPANPFSVPTVAIRDLAHLPPAAEPFHRIKVQGVVTRQRVGTSLHIQDETGGLYVQTQQTTSVQPGDRVEVVGFRGPDLFSLQLQNAIFNQIGSGPPPHPIGISAERVLEGAYEGRLLRLEGELSKNYVRAKSRVLVLHTGTSIFRAQIGEASGGSALASLAPGSRLLVTGPCQFHKDEEGIPRSFRIMLRSPEDVAILERPPWWTSRRLQAAVLIVGATFLAAAAWALTLQRGVRRQTALIQEQLQREAVFSSLGRHLSVANSPKEAARVIVDAAQNLIGWDACSFDLHTPALGQTEPILRLEIVNGQWVEIAPSPADGETAFLTRRTITDGAALVAREPLPEEPGISAEPGGEGRSPASLMFVPIRHGEKIGGVLSIRRYQPNAYREEDLTTLQALADHCGGALERIRGREELVEAERKYRSIFENAVEGVFQSTPAGKCIAVNPAFARILGYTSPMEIIQQCPDIARQVYADPAQREEFIRRVERDGLVTGFEHEALRKDGTKVWISLNVRAVRNAEGQTILYEGSIEDITERKRVEVRNAAFSVLGHRLSSAMTAREAGGIIMDIAERLFGWDACTLDLYSSETGCTHNVLNKDILDGRRVDCAPGHDDEEPTPRARRIIERGGELILREPPCVMAPDSLPFGDTQRASASLMLVPIRDGKQVIGIVSIQSYTPKAYTEQDLETLQTLADHCGGALNRIRTRDALLRVEEQYRDIFENAVEGIYQSTPEGRFLVVNPAMARLFGYASSEEMIKERTDIGRQGYVDPAKREEFKRRIEEHGLVTHFEYEALRKDGSRVWVSGSARAVRDTGGRVIYYEGRLQDISARKKLEEQLRQSQKMEAIGQLAGGVAHDFNNLLTVIQGRSGMLLLEDGLSGRTLEAVGEIALSAERAASLTRQLLTFGRKQAMQLMPLDLNQVVANVTKMLERILGEDIALEVTYSVHEPRIKADPGMLEQILLNLAVNSGDAMPNGGRLIITTSELTADEDYARLNPEASVGAFACLEVGDTGCGISADHLPFIFEPFFTTKEVGQGTGLGLATVYGIVKQHQGWIKVYSEVGHGTTFRIFFPATSEKPTGKTDVTPTKVRGGTEAILVVEDTPCVMEFVKCVLERYGYAVMNASDGPSALDVWETHKDEIQLVLTDMVMPNGMTGLELADKLQSEKPDLKVIYTSGYSADVVAPGFLLHDEVNFLQKPYNPLKLAQTVRQCLDAVPVRQPVSSVGSLA